MTKNEKNGISYTFAGCFLIVFGYLIIQGKQFGSPVEGDTVYLTDLAALFLGSIIIILAIVPLYEGIKSLLKSRKK